MGTKINRQILTDNFSPEKLTGIFKITVNFYRHLLIKILGNF